MQYLPWASTSTTLCSALPRCLDEASYAVFSAIRSYALCAQSCQRLVSTFVFVLSALPGLMDLLVCTSISTPFSRQRDVTVHALYARSTPTGRT
ncbi:hypothetical protein BD309DRAFT_400812 [Dichomitus squalens]|nr:hypothetical protein BD309DRAFT_400812 [Dichomitus squalens]